MINIVVCIHFNGRTITGTMFKLYGDFCNRCLRAKNTILNILLRILKKLEHTALHL